MKVTVKQAKSTRSLWADVSYPVVCKHPDGEIVLAVDKFCGMQIFDGGDDVSEFMETGTSTTWEQAGYIPCTEPVTITFEN